jgi:hypothetical protein
MTPVSKADPTLFLERVAVMEQLKKKQSANRNFMEKKGKVLF